MPRLLCVCLLWLGLLPVWGSHEPSHKRRARRLCGRHLLKGIVKLCGDADWNHFDQNSLVKNQLDLQAVRKLQSFIRELPENSRIQGRGTNGEAFLFSTTASQEAATNNLEMQSPPEYQYNKDNLLPNTTSELASSQDISSYVQEIIEFQNQNTNKVKTLRKLFWGNHPQRIRRGYSEKCCRKGCTEEELIIACLPYIHF